MHDAVWGAPGEFGMARCTGCELRYLSPRPQRQDIGLYYAEVYAGEGLKFEEILQQGKIAAWINAARLRALRKRQTKKGRHLDVGCGVGGLCKQVLKDVATSSVGVDFDHGAVESAQRFVEGHPVEILQGTLSDQDLESASFQSISMIHFLEHSYEPMKELEIAADLLEPGGAIVLEVPSWTSLGRRVFGPFWFPHLAPQHITLFSRKTLERALTDAGFKDVEVRDSYAPLVWISSFVLWYHATLGGRSRFKKNYAVRLFTVIFSLLFFIPMVLADLMLSIALPLLGRGEHIRATALR